MQNLTGLNAKIYQIFIYIKKICIFFHLKYLFYIPKQFLKNIISKNFFINKNFLKCSVTTSKN